MGRQFSFFLGPEDLPAFEDSLRRVGEIAFLLDWPDRPAHLELPGLSTVGMRTLLARPHDVDDLVCKPAGCKDCHSADTFSQNFIECDVITTPHDGFLSEGRLYLVSSYWNESRQKVLKPADFLAWAEKLYRNTKKSLTKIDQHFYAGEQALKMRSNGLKFRNLDGWPQH